jgi:hypothetical protein
VASLEGAPTLEDLARQVRALEDANAQLREEIAREAARRARKGWRRVALVVWLVAALAAASYGYQVGVRVDLIPTPNRVVAPAMPP